MTETQTHPSEVVSALPREPQPSNLATTKQTVVVNPDGSIEPGGSAYFTRDDMARMTQMGFIVPIMQPDELRSLFAMRQRLYAAILDPHDYLYTVAYKENGRDRQAIFSRLEDAQMFVDKATGGQGGLSISAKPKKSGIVKLARALGIVARRTSVKGLPEDNKAQFSCVVYEAIHEATGTKEEGIGWCDNAERGGRISSHDIIATADTRAYNRAVLRLSGFGEVSADEVVAGASEGENLPTHVAESSRLRDPEPRPPLSDPAVQTAARAWAEAIVVRSANEADPYAPAAQQANQQPRRMRARARRGDANVAKQLGSFGYAWEGPAQDDKNTGSFDVEAPPVTPQQVLLVREAAKPAGQSSQAAPSAPATKQAPPAAKPTEPKPEAAKSEPTKGWNLSGAGSAADDKPAPDGAFHGVVIPPPDTSLDTINMNQAKSLSDLLVPLVSGDRARAIAWLKTYCHIDSTREMRANQYEPALKALTNARDAKKEAVSA